MWGSPPLKPATNICTASSSLWSGGDLGPPEFTLCSVFGPLDLTIGDRITLGDISDRHVYLLEVDH